MIDNIPEDHENRGVEKSISRIQGAHPYVQNFFDIYAKMPKYSQKIDQCLSRYCKFESSFTNKKSQIDLDIILC